MAPMDRPDGDAVEADGVSGPGAGVVSKVLPPLDTSMPADRWLHIRLGQHERAADVAFTVLQSDAARASGLLWHDAYEAWAFHNGQAAAIRILMIPA